MIDFNRLLQGKVTYWAPAGTNAQGFDTFATPVVLAGRWEDRREQTTNDRGETITSSSVVYVKDKVEMGGFLHKGDQSGTSDPTTLPNARRIVDFRSIPPLSGDTGDYADNENRALVSG